MILHELFRVVSRFPRYISCYIAESRFPLGQCSVIQRYKGGGGGEKGIVSATFLGKKDDIVVFTNKRSQAKVYT